MATHSGKLLPTTIDGRASFSPSWSIAPVVNNRWGSDWDTASMSRRGATTDTQPVSENPVTHTGRKIISFADDFYNRILIEPSVFDAGNLISDQFYTIKVFNAYFTSKALTQLSISDSEGIVLAGPTTAGEIWGPLQTRNYQLTIQADGPPAINSRISFDWEGTEDDVIIPVTGSRIVMLPYQAEAPLNEELEWKTNVLTSNNGTEQRIRLRKNARQSIKASYPIPPEETNRAFNMAYGWVHRRWAVALWSETQYIGSIATGGTALTCNTSYYDFRANTLVAIWESPTRNEVIEIESVASGVLNLKRVLNTAYTNAILMPVRIGMVSGPIRQDSSGYQSVLQVEYNFSDNVDVGASAPAQFLNNDIYFNYDLMSEDGVTDAISARIDEIDYETGVVEYYTPWRYNRRARNMYVINENPAQSWAFRRWLHRRAGRNRPFWFPTFGNDLRVAMEGNVGTSLRCYDDGYKNLGNKHNHIAIQKTDNTWIPLGVTGISVDGGFIQLALDMSTNPETNFDASLIKRVCFIGLHRLDTDRVEIEWFGNNMNDCTIRILEIAP